MSATTGERAGHPLDGFRALLVLLVVVGHVEITNSLAGGQSRVIAFFALSGFLVTSILLRRHDRTGRVGLRDFYVMRVVRFAPTLVVVMMLAIISSLAYSFGWWAADSVWIGDMIGALPTFLSQTVNQQLQHGVDVPYELVPGWSLGIEWQFYLVWPLVVVGLLAVGSRRVVGWVAAGIAFTSFGLSAWMTISGEFSEARVAYGADTRGGAILLGCAAAVLVLSPQVRAFAARWTLFIIAGSTATIVLLFFMIFFDAGPHMATWGQVVLAFAVCCLCAALWVRPRVAKILAAAPLVWLGQRSLGIFLVHVPIMQILGGRGGMERAVAVVTLTIALVWLTSRFLDRPLVSFTRQRLQASEQKRRAAQAAIFDMPEPALATAGSGSPRP